jgi:hypothetical protein
MKYLIACLCALSFGFIYCNAKTEKKSEIVQGQQLKYISQYNYETKTIHLFVALCDNKYQGIVPVPKGIGNGQDPNTNLYWGCDYGVRTHFKKSREWKLLSERKMAGVVLERLVFKHISKNYYLIADAYDGKFIKQCTTDFLYSNAGMLKDTLHIDHKVIGSAGNSKMVAYIGHDGLMDFQLPNKFINADQKVRDCIILACISRKYFSPYLQAAKAKSVLLTTGLMCPEAYTFHDALTGYVNNESSASIQARAAKAYSKYQKCSLSAAKNLLVVN